MVEAVRLGVEGSETGLPCWEEEGGGEDIVHVEDEMECS